MKTWTVWTLMTLVGCALAVGGCQQDSSNVLTMEQLAKTDLQLHWKAELTNLNKKTGEKVRSLYYEPDRIYVVTTDNRLLALDAFSGSYLWGAELGDKDVPATGVTQLGQAVFVCVLNKLYAFSVMDGQQVRSMELRYAPSTTPVISGEYVYYGTNAGWFMAEGLFDKGQTWNRQTFTAITAAPVYDATRVYFANLAGHVFASSFSKRLIVWEQQLGAAVVGNLARTSSGLVLVPCRDYVLYALNPSTGQVAWLNTTGEPLDRRPHVSGGRVYIIKKGGTLLAIDELTGKTLWQAEDIQEFLSASDRTVFARTTRGTVVGLAVADGAAKFTLASDGLKLAAVNQLDGQLIVGSPDGRIAAIREKAVKYNDPITVPTEKPVAP